MYSLDCELFAWEFNSIEALMSYVIENGVDPNYNITRNGKVTRELLAELIQY